MGKYYDRYRFFSKDKGIGRIPFISIDEGVSDIYITYEKKKMRMDMLSYKYYGDSNYGWLILQANANLGYYEYLIPNNSIIRIPYPLEDALIRYEKKSKSLNI